MTFSLFTVYYVTIAILGAMLILIVFTMEETAYRRGMPDKTHEFVDESHYQHGHPQSSGSSSPVPGIKP